MTTLERHEEPILRIDGLSVRFRTSNGLVRAVEGAGYDVRRGETLAVVGESGCGKSVTAMAVLGLLPKPPAEIANGTITFEGEDLLRASPERLREIRGNRISMIFQEPMTSLNPVFTVGDQIMEGLTLHRGLSREEARQEAVHLLELVRIPARAQRIDEYPHQLSGGMRQRVMIAIALACRPRLLIADEPTTALDVTVQAQILELLRELQRELSMSIVLITHDLGVVAETAERVVVMYAGNVVERATALSLFDRPRHPYTAGLFLSLPSLGAETGTLRPIEGSVPDMTNPPSGCRFHPRCPFAMAVCREREPALVRREAAGEATHESACFYVDEHPGADLVALTKKGAPA
ncbi:MAG TPA: ABC transporter ATP-binding protein [Polyangiaceae bacterium]|nr:ABC transporter ATP-binding protein [Polyangiaceae bacterium]